MLLFNLKIAWRNLWKNKVFSAVNILGLSLSIACCLVLSIYVWNELSYDSFHKNSSNIYRLTEKQNQGGKIYDVAVTPGPLAPALKKDFPEIKNTVRFGKWSGTLKNGINTFDENNIQLTENSIFSIFNFDLLKGNPTTALKSPDEMVITEKTAEKYFGKDWQTNSALLGQVFRYNGELDFKLAGVVKNPPENSSIQFDILLPIQYLFSADEWSYKWNSNNYHTYIELASNANVPTFEKKIANQLHIYNVETNDVLQLQPLGKQYLYSNYDFNTDWGKRSDIKYIKIFSGVGLLLLIIACVNFINLSTARSLKRSMEVGVRKVNGASRKQLVMQFLSESVLIAFLSALLSIVMIQFAQPYLKALTGSAIIVNYSSYLFILLAISFITIIGVLAGLYPAVFLSSFNPVKVFKGNGHSGQNKSFLKSLVVVQFAISIALMICTFFMYRQLNFIQSKDLGFNKEQLVSVQLKGGMRGKTLLFKHDLDQQSDIVATSAATMSLINVENTSYLGWEGMQPTDTFLITQANVDPDFIPTMGMQLLNGRNFSPQMTNDTATFIVNETAAKRMGYTLTSAINKKIDFWGAKGKIIGVVKDFNFKPLNSSIEPFLFRYQPMDNYFTMLVKTAPGNTAAAITQMQKQYKKYEADTPMDFSFVNESINRLYLQEKRTAGMILLFASLTIFVGCLGLFGLTVFAAERRIKEIGIRKVLGAGIASLAGLLSKDFLQLIILASIIATPVAWFVTGSWLQNYAYRISMDWWVFATVGFSVIIVSLATISVQAIKAAIANPVKSLRTE